MDQKTTKENRERLLRAIRSLQQIQRSNSPDSSIAKAAGKGLAPLLKEMAGLPPEAAPLTGEPS